MEKSKFFDFFAIVATFCMHTIVVKGFDSSWYNAHATFYGGTDASGTMGGACGYGNLYTYGYGTNTAALSTQLFNDGASCGQCYLIYCDYNNDPQWCYPGASVTITATNFCPPNWNLPSDNGGWCNPPREHFDMAQPAFQQIANTHAGIVPVWYQRVSCWKRGNVRVTLNGFNYFNLFLVWNVGGAGSIAQFWVKGDSSGWVQASRNWGANWQVNGVSLNGQALTFAVTNSDWQTLNFPEVVPYNWYFGQTYECYANFY
ncbi:Expansin [Rhynchospora pubera]|uniref:Expansin n=1 Tax=Rhynchospora pubera TaxID=906938 RepID=A0AAV8EYI6_9POAL|nr:Expansin [Rhynchospora pubera]KAJ4784485.1 Expansin [Rhynchospora pubera]